MGAVVVGSGGRRRRRRRRRCCSKLINIIENRKKTPYCFAADVLHDNHGYK